MTAEVQRGTIVIATGPLFGKPAEALREACAEGLRRLADIGTETMRYAMLNYGLARTGRTISSIRAIHRNTKRNTLGYWIITPTDVWSGELHIRQTGTVRKVTRGGRVRSVKQWSVRVARSTGSGRPTRSWLAYGERGGRRLRRSTNYYARTTQALRRIRYSGVFLPLITEKLG